MTHARLTFPRALRLITLAAVMAAPAAARADEYSDVNQLLRAGKNAEAMAKADQYLAAKPRDPQMRFLKGVIQTESGRPTEAISTFNKLTEDYPELPEPYNNLAVLYAGQSQFDKARAALEMAIRTNPSYTTAHENLGDVYAKLASQAYSKALQLDSGNTAVQPKLALIRELFGPVSKGGRQAPAAAAPLPAPTVVAKAPVAATTPAARPATPAAATPAAAAPATAAPARAPAPVAAAPAAAAPSPAPVPSPAAVPAAASSAGAREVETALNAWAAAWSSKDIGGYLGAYSRDFDPPGNLTRKAWEDERRARIVGKSRISVRLSDVAVSVNGTKAVARFKQAYSADALNVSSRKTVEMQKVGDRWVIVRENVGA